MRRHTDLPKFRKPVEDHPKILAIIFVTASSAATYETLKLAQLKKIFKPVLLIDFSFIRNKRIILGQQHHRQSLSSLYEGNLFQIHCSVVYAILMAKLSRSSTLCGHVSSRHVCSCFNVNFTCLLFIFLLCCFNALVHRGRLWRNQRVTIITKKTASVASSRSSTYRQET